MYPVQITMYVPAIMAGTISRNDPSPYGNVSAPEDSVGRILDDLSVRYATAACVIPGSPGTSRNSGPGRRMNRFSGHRCLPDAPKKLICDRENQKMRAQMCLLPSFPKSDCTRLIIALISVSIYPFTAHT